MKPFTITVEGHACQACDWFGSEDELGEITLTVPSRAMVAGQVVEKDRQVVVSCCPLCMGDIADAEVTEVIPAKWVICPRCEGNGKHDHPAFANGITSSEFAEWDDDERETYRSGGYDVTCDECHGSGKVRVPDREVATEAERALIDQYEDRQAERAAWDREDAHTRRMERGGWD